MGEYKNDGQRKAVHASRADGGEGAPSKMINSSNITTNASSISKAIGSFGLGNIMQGLVPQNNMNNQSLQNHVSTYHQDDAQPVTDFAAQRTRERDQAILNPMDTSMIGNIQPNVYNQTGFSGGAMDVSNQMFNTPDERNKII
jgi:hypothetical protein